MGRVYILFDFIKTAFIEKLFFRWLIVFIDRTYNPESIITNDWYCLLSNEIKAIKTAMHK